MTARDLPITTAPDMSPGRAIAVSPSEPLLADLTGHLATEVDPIAERLDWDADALAAAFQALGDRGWLALRVPVELGGAGLDDGDYGRVREAIARYSGALAFLQAQHQSAAAIVAASPNALLKTQYLPELASGRRRLGIGFSHLRRPGAPLLRAPPTADGYELTGNVPWLTGWGCFQDAVTAAVLPDGQIVFVLVPINDRAAATVTFSDPLSLAAMGATRTVSMHCDRHLVPQDQWVATKSASWIADADRRNILAGAFFALGCANAAIAYLDQTSDRKPWLADCAPVEALRSAWHTERQHLYHACDRTTAPLPWDQRLALRARAIALAFRCTQAAIVASGGAANGQHNRASRLYREAIVFAVTGQTPAIAQASLSEIIH